MSFYSQRPRRRHFLHRARSLAQAHFATCPLQIPHLAKGSALTPLSSAFASTNHLKLLQSAFTPGVLFFPRSGCITHLAGLAALVPEKPP